MNRNLVIALILVTIAQVLSYLQLQGQFIYEWMQKNIWASVLLGLPISWLLINFTKYCKDAFDGQIWPGRLIGFAIGAMVFAIMSVAIFSEAINLKTSVSLLLAIGILCIQLFWK